MILAVLVPSHTRAAGKGEAWVEVSAPNFRVISNAGQKRAEQVAVQFETIRAVFRNALEIAKEHPTPLVTVVAVKDEKALSELLPEYWATKGHSHPAGLYFSGFNKPYVAIRLDAGENGAYETIYHEYYHSLTVPYVPGVPVWVLEGTAEFFGHTEIVGKEVRMGEPDPNLLAFLQQERMPLSTLMQVDRSSPYYNEQNKTSIFYAEAWALVHYLMLGDKLAHQKRLSDFLLRIGNNEPQEQAAREAFGDLNELQKQLNSYVARSSYPILTMSTPDIEAKNFPSRELSEADIDAIEGDCFVQRHRLAEAEPILKKSLALDPMGISARESFGLLEYSRGNHQEAERWMKEAIDLDSKDYLTYYYHAILSDQGHVADAARIAQVESDLRRSIALNPDFAPSYSALALSETRQREKWPDALGLAERAVQLEPGTLAPRLNLGQVLMRMGRQNDAVKIAEGARLAARTSQERSEADEFIASIKEYLRAVESANSAARAPAAVVPEGNKPVSESNEVAPPAEDRTESPTNSHAELPSAQSPAAKLIDGNISDESCARFRLNLTLTNHSQPLKLHAGNYTKVEYWTNDWKPPDNFNPCVDLKGIRVRVSFTSSSDNSDGGEIQKIEVLQQQSHKP